VDRTTLIGIDRACLIDRATQYVHDTAQCACTDGHADLCTGGLELHTATQTVGRSHGNGTDNAVTQLLLHFQSQTCLCGGICFIDNQCVIHLGHLIAWELNVNHGTDTLNNFTCTHFKFLIQTQSAK
jgi:hypothetical protein